MAEHPQMGFENMKSKVDRSTLLVILFTAAALLLGLVLRGLVNARVSVVERAGVRAEVPAGWLVERGLAGEEMVFTTVNPLNPAARYTVNLLPSGEEIHFNDLVFSRNYQRGQSLESYVVLEQSEVIFDGRPAFRVHYAYVLNHGNGAVPEVMEGMDYYFLTLPKALVVSLEARSDRFGSQQARFKTFVASVTYTSGGGQ